MPWKLRRHCFLAMTAQAAVAAIFSTSVSDRMTYGVARSGPRQYIQDPQRILSAPDQDDLEKTPLQDVALIAYGVNITIGTPPQTIQVLLDNNFPYLFVQSTDCTTPLCTSYRHKGFNNSASDSYRQEPEGQRLEFEYANAVFEGLEATDSLTLAGLQIKQQPHENVVSARPVTFFHWYFDYDGVLGFGRLSSASRIKSPWQTVTQNDLLERNILTFIPPHGTRDLDQPRTNGKLILGALPPDIAESDHTSLPLLSPEPRHHSSWATTLQSITYRNESTTLLRSTYSRNATAYFSTALPYFQLPRQLVDAMYSYVGPTQPTGFFEAFPCEKRKSLPDIVLGIGDRNITLGALQYTFELNSTSRGSHSCVIPFEKGDYSIEDDVQDLAIGLGWPFLENFKVVFDQDKEEVLLIPLTVV